MIAYNLLMILLNHKSIHQILNTWQCVNLDTLNIILLHKTTNIYQMIIHVIIFFDVYGDKLNLNKDKLIKLNIEFHRVEDVEEGNKPEYIEIEFGEMIISPKFNNISDLQQAQYI